MAMDNSAYDDQRDKAETNLQDHLAIVLKRKWTIISFALVVLTTVTIGSFLAKPTYTAKGTLLLEKEANILSFQDIFQIETFSDDYYQTQYKLLQSRTLANDTIDRLKLYENEKFIGKINNTVGLPDKSDTLFRERLIENFLGRLGIEPISQTRLGEVYFKTHNTH